jgi:hypothetical protein
MSKCFIYGCNEPVVGGFEQRISVPGDDNPNDTLPGMKTGWCARHEKAGLKGVANLPGRAIPKREFDS